MAQVMTKHKRPLGLHTNSNSSNIADDERVHEGLLRITDYYDVTISFLEYENFLDILLLGSPLPSMLNVLLYILILVALISG